MHVGVRIFYAPVATLSYAREGCMQHRHTRDQAARAVALRLSVGGLFAWPCILCPQVRFVLDSESQNPTDVQMYALKEVSG